MNDTLLAASLLKNTGLVVANDAKKERTKALVANIHRLGEFCVSVVIIYIATICITFVCFTCMAMEKKGVKNSERFLFITSWVGWWCCGGLTYVNSIPLERFYLTKSCTYAQHVQHVWCISQLLVTLASFLTNFCSTKYIISYHFFLSAGISNTLVCNYDGRAFPRVRYLIVDL